MDSNGFKILKEHTFYFKGKDICLMLQRDLDRFGVEIVSPHESFGRTYFASKKHAERYFEFCIKELSRSKDYDSIVSLLRKAKQTKDLYKTVILLKTAFGRKFNQEQVGGLIKDFGLKVKSKVSKDKKMTIKVCAERERKTFGTFMGTFLKRDFVFKVFSFVLFFMK